MTPSRRTIRMSESILGNFSAGANTISRTLIDQGSKTVVSPQSTSLSFGSLVYLKLPEMLDYHFFCFSVSNVSYTASYSAAFVRLSIQPNIRIFDATYIYDTNSYSVYDPSNIAKSGVYYAPLNTDILCTVPGGSGATITFSWAFYSVRI